LERLDRIECRDAVLDTSAWAELGLARSPPGSARAELVEAPASTSTSSVRTGVNPVRA